MITITKGEKAVFTIKLRDKDGDPFPLTAFDRFKVAMPIGSGAGVEITQTANSSGSVVAVDGNPLLGKLSIVMNKADTAKLLAEDRLPVDVELDNSVTPNPKRQRFTNALNVVETVLT
jgi:hypothetical protein